MTDQLIDKIVQKRYQIQSLLGRQTGRRTFLAKDLQTQSPVVVKLLLFNPDFTWDDLKLFQREAETLRNLDHPAIPLSTAKQALEILQNDDLPLNCFSTLKVRPQNNRIILKKTDQNLRITIPLYFKDILIYLDQKHTTYTVKFLWIIIQRKVLITKELVKLEQLFDCLNVRFKSDYFSIKLLNAIEAEWLFYELSHWLDLSIKTTYETDQPTHVYELNDKLIPENTFKDPNNNLVNSSNSSRTRQPSSIQCTIEKCSDFIEVSAPAKTNSGCFVTLACFVLIIFFGAVGGAFGLVFCIIFIIAYSTNSNPTKKSKKDRIILQIAKNTARLYKNSYPDKSLKQIFTKAILKIEVVYYSPRKYNSTDYHIALKTGLRDQLLVGNRTHWLSEREAYWIALELSQWLKVPITEREVVVEVSD